jgi:hypothetical protein
MFHLVSDMTEQCKGKCLYTCMVTTHFRVMGLKQQFVYRESECLYTHFCSDQTYGNEEHNIEICLPVE